MLPEWIDLCLGILYFHTDLACLHYTNRQAWTHSHSDLEVLGDLGSFDLERGLNIYILSSNKGVLNGVGGNRCLYAHMCSLSALSVSLSPPLFLSVSLSLSHFCMQRLI